MSQLRLRGTAGAILGVERPLTDMLIIGRSPEADLCIDHPTVCAQHAVVVRVGQSVIVSALSYTSPTKVATPALQVAVAVPVSDPVSAAAPAPAAAATVTIVVESAITVFPPRSVSRTTGCAVKAAPPSGPSSMISVITPQTTECTVKPEASLILSSQFPNLSNRLGVHNVTQHRFTMHWNRSS
jgi:hypothetical protein